MTNTNIDRFSARLATVNTWFLYLPLESCTVCVDSGLVHWRKWQSLYRKLPQQWTSNAENGYIMLNGCFHCDDYHCLTFQKIFKSISSIIIKYHLRLLYNIGYSIVISDTIQAEPWWRASIWRSHRKVVMKQCSYHNNIIDIQNRLPYSKVVYPAIIVLFSCLMEVNHGVRTGPDYPFR